MTMWKKNPTAADCKQFMYNETEWPGKNPKHRRRSRAAWLT